MKPITSSEWMAEAARLSEESSIDPNAFTIAEFAAKAGVPRGRAYKRVLALIAEKRAVVAKKMVKGRLTAAYKMVK